jgi:membrane-bound lytic murein transglycosylase D
VRLATPPRDRGRPLGFELRSLEDAEARLFTDLANRPELTATAALVSDDPAHHLCDDDHPWLPELPSVAETGAVDPARFAGIRLPGFDFALRPELWPHLQYFTTTEHGRRIFSHWLARGGRYRDAAAQALVAEGLPEGLVAVAMLSSGFSPWERSSGGAAGIWQLMPTVSRGLGLEVQDGLDERRDPGRSSLAAARYLHDLWRRLGSWELALAAFDVGVSHVEELCSRTGDLDFWRLAATPGALPVETRVFVLRVLAGALVLSNLDRFGFDRVPVAVSEPALPLDVPPGTGLYAVARAAGTSQRRLRELNPALTTDRVPNLSRSTVLVPGNGLARARVMLPRLLQDSEAAALAASVSEEFDWGSDELPGPVDVPPRANPPRPGEEPPRLCGSGVAGRRRERGVAPGCCSGG